MFKRTLSLLLALCLCLGLGTAAFASGEASGSGEAFAGYENRPVFASGVYEMESAVAVTASFTLHGYYNTTDASAEEAFTVLPFSPGTTAALYPSEEYLSEGYLYFCNMNPKQTNRLVFSKTYEEHHKNVVQYSPFWE